MKTKLTQMKFTSNFKLMRTAFILAINVLCVSQIGYSNNVAVARNYSSLKTKTSISNTITVLNKNEKKSLANTSKERVNDNTLNANAFMPNTTVCNSTQCILDAMRDANPGDEIVVAPGVYEPQGKFSFGNKATRFGSDKNGTQNAPIILRAQDPNNRPVFKGPSGRYDGYGIYILGDYWILKDLIVEECQKGIVFDNANNGIIDNVLVRNIGEEGIHLRDGSSNNLVTGCVVTNTGIVKPGIGEGLYSGSDRKQHETNPTNASKLDFPGNRSDNLYNPDCFDNTFEFCTIGPNVAAEGADIKEGTKNTIIRNCTFIARGISGENSSDAFIDLKGAYGFVYNNTFDIDGSTVINAGVDVLDRGIQNYNANTGFRNAIFSNIFNLGSRANEIQTVRKKQGDIVETHLWDNVRNPDSPDFPVDNGTEKVITKSCPSWNIVPCDGVIMPNPQPTPNQAPSVSITSPSNNQSFNAGANITVNATASDNDGQISKVEFFNGNNKLGEDTTAPYNYTISNAATGNYNVTARATDNDNATTTSTNVTFRVNTEVVAEFNRSIQFENINSTLTVEEGYTLYLNVLYNDDGSDIALSNVQLFINNTFVRRESFVPYEWGHSNSPNPNELNNLSAGNYIIKAEATDANGEILQREFTLTVNADVQEEEEEEEEPSSANTCSFGTPLASALPSYDRVSFNNIHVLGNGGPDVSKIRRFRINWDASRNGLYQFAINTTDGVPSYYINILTKMSFNFNTSNPELTISNFDLPGWDGDYWVANDGDNFVMVSKTGGYSIYFNNGSAPNCSTQSAKNIALAKNNAVQIKLFPNPSTNVVNVSGLTEQVNIAVVDMLGKTIINTTNNALETRIEVSKLPIGVYFMKINGRTINKTMTFIKK